MLEPPEEDEYDLRDRWVEARKAQGKPLPLIMHEEVYTHFRTPCSIVEANVYDKVDNAEVVIESGEGTRTTIEFNQLSWRPYRIRR